MYIYISIYIYVLFLHRSHDRVMLIKVNLDSHIIGFFCILLCTVSGQDILGAIYYSWVSVVEIPT